MYLGLVEFIETISHLVESILGTYEFAQHEAYHKERAKSFVWESHQLSLTITVCDFLFTSCPNQYLLLLCIHPKFIIYITTRNHSSLLYCRVMDLSIPSER